MKKMLIVLSLIFGARNYCFSAAILVDGISGEIKSIRKGSGIVAAESSTDLVLNLDDSDKILNNKRNYLIYDFRKNRLVEKSKEIIVIEKRKKDYDVCINDLKCYISDLMAYEKLQIYGFNVDTKVLKENIDKQIELCNSLKIND